MRERIITISDFRILQRNRLQTPANYETKVCRPAHFITTKLDPPPSPANLNPRAADGLRFSITSSNLNVSVSQYFNGENVISSFVILREVLEEMISGGNGSISIYIYKRPSKFLVLCGSTEMCTVFNDPPPDAGEGTKVSIPNPPPRVR